MLLHSLSSCVKFEALLITSPLRAHAVINILEVLWEFCLDRKGEGPNALP